jgi:hypothetical protein
LFDYTNDLCAQHFTPGQAARSSQKWNTLRATRP